MTQTRFNLRAMAAALAVLLFAVTLLVATHAHAAKNPEKSEHCATCQLLPQGLKLLPKLAAPVLPACQALTTVLPCQLRLALTQRHSLSSIRGPPAFL